MTTDTPLTPHFDVIVIGAGPAGSWTAALLAGAGASVAILDGSHPREKPCGGGVTGRALDVLARGRFDVACDRVIVNQLRVAFGAPDRDAVVPLPEGSRPTAPLSIVSRAVFDHAILTEAVRRGGAWIDRHATEVQLSKDGVTVRTSDRTFTAGFVVGADGVGSLVRRSVQQKFVPTELVGTYGWHVATSQPGTEACVKYLPDGSGYMWSFPRPDHVSYGIGTDVTDQSPATRRRYLDEWMQESGVVINSRSDRRYGWPIPTLPGSALRGNVYAGPRWMLVGDAAGLVDAITGEGIYYALRSAELSAQALGGSAAEAPRVYDASVRALILPELSRASRLHHVFFHPLFLRAMLAAIAHSEGVNATLADLVAGTQPYDGLKRRLLKSMTPALVARQLLAMVRG